jgi:hypothetical protein
MDHRAWCCLAFAVLMGHLEPIGGQTLVLLGDKTEWTRHDLIPLGTVCVLGARSIAEDLLGQLQRTCSVNCRGPARSIAEDLLGQLQRTRRIFMKIAGGRCLT